MLARFTSHIRQQHLFPSGQEVLLAISGGIDSSVLAHLMHCAGIPFAMAHCNFHLRPGDCDRDESFVRQLAERYGVRLHVAHFDTEEYARQEGLCIEDAARRLRYDYFEQLRRQEGYAAIWVAHHRDDSAETFFINLLRGTGLAGLHGILPQQGHIVRPLLPFGRDEIEAYAKAQGLAHAEDATNQSLNYRRNQVRHQLLPLLRSMQPAFDRTMQETTAHLRSTERLYQALLAPLRERCMKAGEKNSMVCDLHELSSALTELGFADDEEMRVQILFELLREYGFCAAVISDICATNKSGKRFYSTYYEALMDREQLLLRPMDGLGKTVSESMAQIGVRRMCVEELPYDVRRMPAGMAVFDAERVRLPLSLRHWREGDRFQPFGMEHGTQLVSDYFTDHKYSCFDKQRQWLLVDADDHILWIVDQRTSHLTRITSATKHVLLVSVEGK